MITFGKPDENLPRIVRVCAYAVIQGEHGAVAAVQHREKLFLPGGGIEAGETAADAVHREAKEETGYAVTLVEHLGDTLQYSLYEGSCYELRATFFRATLDEVISATREHDLIWVDPDQLHHPCHAWAARR